MSHRNLDELAAFVRDADRLDDPPFLALAGEIRHDVADGVVSCLAGLS